MFHTKGYLVTAVTLLSSVVLAACGGDSGSDKHQPHTAGAAGQSAGGSPGSGGQSVTGGRSATGGQSATGGVGTTGGEGGGTVTGGRGGGGNASNGGAAGGPAAPQGGGGGIEGPNGGYGGGLPSAGGEPATSGGAANGGTAGSGAVEAGGGAGGAPVDECAPLCDGDCGGQAPPCLSDAFGIAEGESAVACLPEGSRTVTVMGISVEASWCSAQTCGGAPGCALSLYLDTVDWDVDSTGSTTSVDLSAAISEVSGSVFTTLNVGGTPTQCEFTVSIPVDEAVLVTATSSLQPNGAVMTPVVSGVTVDASQASLATDSGGLCDTAALVIGDSFRAQLGTEIENYLQTRATALRCLECGSGCPSGIACVEP